MSLKTSVLYHHILTNKTNLQIELLEVLENEDLKQFKNMCHSKSFERYSYFITFKY